MDGGGTIYTPMGRFLGEDIRNLIHRGMPRERIFRIGARGERLLALEDGVCRQKKSVRK